MVKIMMCSIHKPNGPYEKYFKRLFDFTCALFVIIMFWWLYIILAVLVRMKLGKPVNPSLHVGICGEHGGEPSSVIFCDSVGMNYVSCSPFRVPIARIAAAQAALSDTEK